MRKQRVLLLRLALFMNVVFMTSPFCLTQFLMRNSSNPAAFSTQTELLILLITAGLYILFGKIYDAFMLDVGRIQEVVYSQMLAISITDACGFLLIWMVRGSFPSLLRYWLILPVQFFFSVIWSIFSHRWYFRHFPAKKTLMLADDPAEAQEFAQRKGFAKKFHVADVLTTEQLLQNPDERLKDVRAIFLLHTSNAWAVMQLCAFRRITVYRVPLVSEIIASRAKPITLFHTPLLRMDGYKPPMSYVLCKRLIDLVFSCIALTLLSPIMLIVAIAIKLDDHGPIFYQQERLTQGGRHFYILKFRSMRVNAESDGVARLSTGENDPRITPVGRWIRMLRLDELPQLLNILKGDMSIVGPRPERPALTEEYAQAMPEFKLRLLANAGLTGYAQVYGKYNSTPAEKLRMDLLYILHPSIVEDLRIMLTTVKILFVPESTEGVAEGQTTAMTNEQPQK